MRVLEGLRSRKCGAARLTSEALDDGEATNLVQACDAASLGLYELQGGVKRARPVSGAWPTSSELRGPRLCSTACGTVVCAGVSGCQVAVRLERQWQPQQTYGHSFVRVVNAVVDAVLLRSMSSTGPRQHPRCTLRRELLVLCFAINRLPCTPG